MQKKYIILLILLIVAAGLLVVKFKPGIFKKTTDVKKEDATVTTQPMVKATELETNKISNVFPADLPWEKNVQVVRSVEFADPSTGKTQALRAYISKKTLDENYTVYSSYLQNKKWQLTENMSQPEVKSLTAKLDGSVINIAIQKNTEGKNLITVSYAK